jgi:hypothetical protein
MGKKLVLHFMDFEGIECKQLEERILTSLRVVVCASKMNIYDAKKCR